MLADRILITGANGLLGQALTRRLSTDDDYAVLATAWDDTLSLDDVPCDYTSMDVTAPEEVEHTFSVFEPNVVVNCAALSDVSTCENNRNEAWATNARAVKRLARHCNNHRTHLVQISTDFVFNGKRGPYDESAQPDPVNYYGRTKLAAENHVREAGRRNWTIVRTVLLYGTGTSLSRKNVVLWLVDELKQGNPVHVVNDQWRTPTYVPDLAAGIDALLQTTEKTGIYHLSGPDMVSIHELAIRVADVFNLDESLIHPVPSDDFDESVERPSKTGFRLEKARTELEYNPRSLTEGLQALKQDVGFTPSP